MAEAKKTTKKAVSKTTETKKAKTPLKTEDSKSKVDAAPAVEPEETSVKPLAKAGKRSAKAVKEKDELQAKEERKAEAKIDDADVKPKVSQKPSRSKFERRSKGYRKVAALIEKDKLYNLVHAMDLATQTSPVKFDATVELHVRLNVDPKQADQNIRDTIVLPAGTGKTLRVAVFAEPDSVVDAKKAGADIAAADEFLQQLDKEQTDFDVLISTPAMMAKLGKYAKVLGPKGLMPNPKSGTVTNDITKAVKEAKAGKVEYRVDSAGIIHVGVGKVSFGKDKLTQNAQAIMVSIRGNKPSSVKGAFINSAYATTSMGPSIQLDLGEVSKL